MEDHSVLVIVRGGKCLFVQRSMQKKQLPGAWAFASGTVESGESLQHTAKRESMEEFGVEVKPIQVFAKHELEDVKIRLNFVLCELVRGEPKVMDPAEAERLAWMSMNEFFAKYTDDEIGHGLRWLRANPKAWQNLGL